MRSGYSLQGRAMCTRQSRSPRQARQGASLALAFLHAAKLVGDDDSWVELLEQRLGCAELLPDGQARRCPRPGRPRVVTGKHVVRRAVGFADRPPFRGARDSSLIAEILMQLLAREGQEGREHHLESIDRAQRDVQNSSGSFSIRRDQLPGLGLGQVLIDERGEVKQFLEGRAKARSLEMVADIRESGLDRLDEARVAGGELARLGDLPETPMSIDERAMREVAPW